MSTIVTEKYTPVTIALIASLTHKHEDWQLLDGHPWPIKLRHQQHPRLLIFCSLESGSATVTYDNTHLPDLAEVRSKRISASQRGLNAAVASWLGERDRRANAVSQKSAEKVIALLQGEPNG